jgi:voltage-gated potassium channel
MAANEPDEPIVQEVERDVKRVRPIQRLLLLDVFRDHESRPVFYWAGGMLLAGVLVYHFLEGWSYLDALYFCVVSLATVGYGDLTPTTPLAKIFTIIYLINGIGILLALFDRIRVVRARAIENPAQGKRKS